MQGIQYCRVHSPIELLALVKMLPSILATDRKVFSFESLKIILHQQESNVNCQLLLYAIGEAGGGGYYLILIPIEYQ